MSAADVATIKAGLACGKARCTCRANGNTHCPAHADATPSLSVKAGDKVPVIVTCHGGCSQEAVVDALNERALWPQVAKPERRNGRARAKPKRYAGYSAIDGRHVADHVRLDLPGGKRMWWEQPDGTKNLGGFPVTDLALYGVRELPSDGPVVVCEGEKSRDALKAHDVAAVATVTGAAATPCDHALRTLLGRPVALWPDNEPEGQMHMQRNAARLRALGHDDVRRIDWPDAPLHGDAADFTGTDAELRALIDGAMPFGDVGVQTPTDDLEHLNPGPVVVSIADVAREAVTWRWRNRLPVGKLTIVEGDPGVGKSHFTLAIATAVTLGASLPGDDSTFEPQRVLILTAEDGLGDTIRPRLEDMGADLSLVSALTAVRDADGRERFPSLVDDVTSIESVLRAGGYGLVIIDPINAYLRGVDGHADVDVRSVLGPLAQLAERFAVAVVCIRHLTKSARDRAIYRGSGSIAYTAAARSVLLVGQNPDDERERVVVCVKHNLAADSPAIAFEISDGRFMWGGESDVTASQLLAPDQDDADRSAREEAIAFLNDALADGPRPAQDCQRDAAAAGLAPMTLRRARAALHVVITRRGEPGRRGGGSWWWALPGVAFDLDVQVFTVGQENTLISSEAEAATQTALPEHLNPPAAIAPAADDEHCRDCGADVWRFTDSGGAYCERHQPPDE